MTKQKAIIISGPTATGKTKLAFEIAAKFPAYIINADSMQFYNNLRILTNRPTEVETTKHNCKLFGVLKAPDTATLGWWLTKVLKVIQESRVRNKVPIIVGGSGLYLNALEGSISFIPKVKLKVREKLIKIFEKKKDTNFFYKKLRSLDPLSADQINQNDTQRILRAIEVKISSGKTLSYWKSKKKKTHNLEDYIFIVLTKERQELYRDINTRFIKMLESGVVNEVEVFLKSKVRKSHSINKAIGLKHLRNYISGSITIGEAITLCQRDTRNYAKRQMTWFRHQPIDPYYEDYNNAKRRILRNLDMIM